MLNFIWLFLNIAIIHASSTISEMTFSSEDDISEITFPSQSSSARYSRTRYILKRPKSQIEPKKLVNGRIHRGFRHAFEDLYRPLKQALADHCGGKQLYIGGHSLGGVLSILTTYGFMSGLFQSNLHGTLKEIITFGTPRMASDSFYKHLLEFSDTQEIPILQYRNGRFKGQLFSPDPITRSSVATAIGFSTTYRSFYTDLECINYQTGKKCRGFEKHVVSNYVNSLLLELARIDPSGIFSFDIIGRDGKFTAFQSYIESDEDFEDDQ